MHPGPDSPRPEGPPVAELARGLDHLLSVQLGRVRRRFLLHGLGWLLAVLAALTVTYYAVDRVLGLPPGVRVLLSLAFVGYLVLAVRRVIYPLTRALHRDDIAVAIERRFPELHERLISAVQLSDLVERGRSQGDAALRNQSAAMIGRLVEDAFASVRRVPQQQLLDARRTARVWGFAGASAATLLTAVLLHPAAFGVFLSRVLGVSASYPRLTTLVVELPDRPEYRVLRDGRSARLTMAAGDELPVMVRADGVVPREVFLMVEGGRGMLPQVAMTARGGGRFRHVFRRVNDGFSFHASGGDDELGDLHVTVVTVQPPRVGTIRATLTPPAYTGLDPVTQLGGALEALEGTDVEIQVTSTSAVRQAGLTFLESGREIDLLPQTVSDDEGTREILTGVFRVERSDRYQVRLTSPGGLKNPHPGTYPVVAITDHAPHGRILSPTDDSLSVVLPSALIPLRLEARDDYGLASVTATIEVSKVETGGTRNLMTAVDGQPAVRQTVLTHLLEVADLPIEGTAVSVGDTITLGAELTDNRQPEALKTAIPGRPVHVVGGADLARRIAGHFRRIRESVGDALETQRRLYDRLAGAAEELRAGRIDAALRNDITVVQVGQARVQNRAERIHVELMRSFDLHLFNRLEDSPHAQRVLEMYLSYHVEHPEPEGFLPGFYQMLGAERRGGRLGSMPKTLDPILDMTLTCARIATDLGPAAVKVLDESAVATETGRLRATLTEGERLQAEILAGLQSLQDRLDEWNEFQDVIIHTRSVLDKQREVQVRTRDLLRGEDEPRGKR